jgi:hypothetical protein
VSRFPGLREAVHGRRLARRGITFRDLIASERPPYAATRYAEWRQKYDRLPMELKVENRT